MEDRLGALDVRSNFRFHDIYYLPVVWPSIQWQYRKHFEQFPKLEPLFRSFLRPRSSLQSWNPCQAFPECGHLNQNNWNFKNVRNRNWLSSGNLNLNSMYVTVGSNFMLRMWFIHIKLLPQIPSVLLLNWPYRNQSQVLEFNTCLYLFINKNIKFHKLFTWEFHCILSDSVQMIQMGLLILKYSTCQLS